MRYKPIILLPVGHLLDKTEDPEEDKPCMISDIDPAFLGIAQKKFYNLGMLFAWL